MRSSSNAAGVQIAGSEVRRLRQVILGENLPTFAPRAGISVQYLSQIETGVRTHVSPAVFVRICNALGVPQDERESLVARVAA